MKKLLIFTVLCVLVFGCDDTQKPVMDIVGDVIGDSDVIGDLTSIQEPITDVSVEEVQPTLPQITIENVLDLQPGQYRFKPNTIRYKGVNFENVMTNFQAGTIDPFFSALGFRGWWKFRKRKRQDWIQPRISVICRSSGRIAPRHAKDIPIHQSYQTAL